MLRRAGWLLCAVAWLGCSPSRGDGYLAAHAAARRASSAGRAAEAATAYERAAEQARIPRDASHARQEAAFQWAKAGDPARAHALLQTLAAGQDEYALAARMRLAVATFDADPAQGATELEALIHDAPSSGYARTALNRLMRWHDERGDGEAWLRAQTPQLRGTPLEERVRYEHTRRLEEQGRLDDAKRAYLELAQQFPYPRGLHFDEELTRVAAIDERAGRLDDAIATLRRLLSVRDVASTVGSYEKAAYAAAQQRIAELELRAGRRDRARAAYHALYTDFPTSVMRDDALWWEAELWAEDGHADTQCDRLKTLVRELPDSRYVPCAQLRCRGLERAKSSRAPTECRDYLLRRTSTADAGDAAP